MPNFGQKSKIVFFGTEDFSAVSLNALLKNQFNVVAVVTKPDSQRNRGRKIMMPKVKSIAHQHNIAVYQPQKLAEIIPLIKELAPVTGVLVSYGKIISADVINLFTPAIVNVHPSLLPKYRGPSPIESAILNGDQKTGVSIMQLTLEMDAGPIYCSTDLPLTGKETQEQLYQSLAQKGAEQLVKVLPAIIDGHLQAAPQDKTAATYCNLIKKSDGLINWQQPAELIERQIRAYQVWPQSRTKLGPLEVIITSAQTVNSSSDQAPGTITVKDQRLLIQAADRLIEITRLKPLGKKEMPVRAFLAGYKKFLGVD